LELPPWICGCGDWALAIKKTLHAAEQNRPDVAKKRKHWHEQFPRKKINALVFVDECGANTKMTRWRGRSLIGQRLFSHVPHGHYHTNTLIGAIRKKGALAPCVFDGAMNGELFLTWVKQELVKRLRKNDVVIFDNLRAHKVAGAREAIESVGAQVLLLPPYSPDFNPIENMWSKIKQRLRSLAPRTLEALLSAYGRAFNEVTSSDCKGFFSHAGYDT